ncbi:MAG: hypothetical protein JXQ76_07510 [Campylobacterales bacterium]|nr:hypothetical protein [Campylobacterales bacterium]
MKTIINNFYNWCYGNEIAFCTLLCISQSEFYSYINNSVIVDEERIELMKHLINNENLKDEKSVLEFTVLRQRFMLENIKKLSQYLEPKIQEV